MNNIFADVNEYFKEDVSTSYKNMDLIELAVYLAVKNNLYDDFFIYENNMDINVGIGVLSKIEIYKNTITIKSLGKKEENITFSETEDINKILANIPIDKWNIYGMINFDFAKYTYFKEQLEKEKLIEIILPMININIKNTGQICIKTQDKNHIYVIKKLIDIFKNQIKSEYILNKEISFINYDEEHYKEIVVQAINEIHQNKYDKVILSRKIPLKRRVDMGKSYLYGRMKNTPARSYYIKIEHKEVIGFSPETVIEIDTNKNVYTFPLAGTRALGSSSDINDKLKKELLSDNKEIAEHAISVKLAFEELERCCDKGSVKVINFMEVLKRGTVQHLASRLTGKLRRELNNWDALSALFPAVTATGIPKKESIESISLKEKDERGLYSGGVFTLNSVGEFDVALVLRSAFQNDKESWLRAGAGIMSMSNPERELEETKEKLRSVAQQIIYKDK